MAYCYENKRDLFKMKLKGVNVGEITTANKSNIKVNTESDHMKKSEVSQPISLVKGELQSPFELSTQEYPAQLIQVEEGNYIFEEGHAPEGLYFVKSGCVKVVVRRSQHRGRTTTPEYITKIVSPGEFFGYKALINKRMIQSSAKAIQDTEVLFYTKEQFESAINQSSPLIRSILQQSVRDIDSFEMTSQLHYLASVQERIAFQIVLLASKFGIQTEKGISLNLKLTRNELAQLASTINESLSRHLTDFKNEGLIELNGKEILIKDLAGLKAKSGNF